MGLRELLREQAFHPTWIGLFANPFFLSRRALRATVRELGPRLSGPVLDVGCGSKPYRRYVNAAEYIGVDVASATGRGGADIVFDGRHIPVDAGAMGGVMCTEVLEHVFEPEDFVRELRRVLRTQGLLLLTVPFLWEEHEVPHDFGRYTSFGLRALLERNGFRVVESRRLNPGVRAFAQLAIAAWYRTVEHLPLPLRALLVLPVAVPLTLAGLVLGAIVPPGERFYLDNVVLAEAC